ncbi:MAG: hypothetical protein ACK5WZ_02990 [Pseudobdellovibrionaceae bacterium]
MKYLILCFFCFFHLAAQGSETKTKLQFNTLNGKVTLSGVSSGAFFATQLFMAHSSRIQGFASLAGGIYNCAEGSSQKAQSVCMANPQSIQVQTHFRKAQQLASAGLIDDLSNLKSARTFIYAGKSDSIVRPQASTKLQEFLLQWMKPEQVETNFEIGSGHGWITEDFGNSCTSSAKPWINNCGINLAEDFMNIFKGSDLTNQNPIQFSENLIEFDQTPYAEANSGLDKKGFIYIPKKCAQGQICAAHISFHGCAMGYEYLQKTFVTNTGLNEWAEKNQTIVLYPQIAKSAQMNNPNGCWDWYGYTGENYMNQKGPQIKSIYNMIQKMFQ